MTKTAQCFRDGKWHVDELANLCERFERELHQRVDDYKNLMRDYRIMEQALRSVNPNHSMLNSIKSHQQTDALTECEVA